MDDLTYGNLYITNPYLSTGFSLAERYIYGSERIATIKGPNGAASIPANTSWVPFTIAWNALACANCVSGVAATCSGCTLFATLSSPSIAAGWSMLGAFYSPMGSAQAYDRMLGHWQTTYTSAFGFSQRKERKQRPPRMDRSAY